MRVALTFGALVVGGAVVFAGGGGSPSASQPATSQGTVPAGWAAGLDKEVAGVKPLCLSLWEGEAPGQVAGARPERNDGERIWEVNVPGMIVYLPPKEKRAAAGGVCLVECMGGSYTHLTRLVGADHTVEEFAPKGISIISLKYRLKPPSTNVERDSLADAKRCMRLVRSHAAEWGIDPNKVGMLGWSAGANLLLNLATHFDAGDKDAKDPVERLSCRPDFVAMLSPWPDMQEVTAYPPGKDAPPAFICSARDDRTAPVTFAEAVAAAWEKQGVKAELVEVPTGGHGAFELGAPGEGGKWQEKFLPWLVKGAWLKQP